MEWVDIEHPKISEPARVPKRALGYWLAIGWREKKPEPESAPAREPGAEETRVRSRKRREHDENEEQ